MTKDEILALAKEAGLSLSVALDHNFETKPTLTAEQFKFAHLCRADLVAEVEARKCANEMAVGERLERDYLRSELALAEQENKVLRLENKWLNYTGNNPDKYQSELRMERDLLKAMKEAK